MKGVDVGFYRSEIPNLLVRFGIKYSGGIISATTGFAIDSFKERIVDSKGMKFRYYSEQRTARRYVVLVSEDVLNRYNVYTVKLDYKLYTESQLRSKTWSFKNCTIQGLYAQYDELVLNPGNKLPMQIMAPYGDGTFAIPKKRPPTPAVRLPV